jgi:hypothetical protein
LTDGRLPRGAVNFTTGIYLFVCQVSLNNFARSIIYHLICGCVQEKTWDDARSHCRRLGDSWDLTAIETQQENQQLGEYSREVEGKKYILNT